MPFNHGGLTGGPLPLHPREGARLLVVVIQYRGVDGVGEGEGTHQVVLVEIQNLQQCREIMDVSEGIRY